VYKIDDFCSEVYQSITENEHQYSVSNEIGPGESSILILRQVRGGGLAALLRYKDICDFGFEADKTHVRVHKRADEAE